MACIFRRWRLQHLLERSRCLFPHFLNFKSCLSYTPCQYIVVGLRLSNTYWLSDVIYPNYHCFFHSIKNPKKEEEKRADRQEGFHKDIYTEFGPFQANFHIRSLPFRLWCKSFMRKIIYCCIILHNIIVRESDLLV